MPKTKHQMTRLINLVAELKRNKHSTCASYAKLLGEDARDPITCSVRTIERDIAFLRNVLKAPILYDSARRTYCIEDKTWEMKCPARISDEMMTSTMLGAQLAESIMPEPVKGEIQAALAQHLTSNYSTQLEDAFVESLLYADKLKAAIEPETFRAVYDAWRQRSSITFVYHKPNGKPSSRLFEPHVVSFHNGLWYAKGVSLPDRKVTVFAIHRMSEVKLTGVGFDIDTKLIKDVNENGLFGFPKRDDIKVRCDAEIVFYLREHEKAKNLKIEPQPDGSVIVTLSQATEYDTLRWVLAEAGKIRILEPDSLREHLLESARKIIERNS